MPVLPEDDEDRLAERVLAQEHRAYALALHLFAAGASGAAPAPDAALRNPLPSNGVP